MYLILAQCLLLLAVLAFWLVRRRTHSFFNLRGPNNAHLLLGNIASLVGIGVGQEPIDWIETYGRTSRIRMALSQPALYTVDKIALSFILRSADVFPKQKPLRRQLARYLDDGIVVAEGDVHRRQRKMLAPSFAPGMVRAFGPLFLEQSARLRDKWLGLGGDFAVCGTESGSGEEKEKEGQGQGMRVDVLKDVMDWSMDVIGQAGFGHDMGGLAETRDELAVAFEQSVRNFGKISPMWVVQSMVPFFDYIMNANKAETRRLSRAIFEEKRADAAQKMCGRDILSNLHRLPDEEVVAQIGTLLLAGKANTAFAATWCLYELAQHPNIQERLRTELLATSDPETNTPYLDAVLRESLRLHPSVPQTMRVATEDVVIPLEKPVLGRNGDMISNVELPKGTTVVIHFWGPDANEFNPDRYAAPYVGSAGMWGQLLTFIDGPRGGYRFALAEIKALLFVLLRTFAFEPIPGEDIISWYAIKNQPVVRGQEELGMQLPLIVRPLH